MVATDFADYPYCCEYKLEGCGGVVAFWIKNVEFWSWLPNSALRFQALISQKHPTSNLNACVVTPLHLTKYPKSPRKIDSRELLLSTKYLQHGGSRGSSFVSPPDRRPFVLRGQADTRRGTRHQCRALWAHRHRIQAERRVEGT
jgi:hypothetical protein